MIQRCSKAWLGCLLLLFQFIVLTKIFNLLLFIFKVGFLQLNYLLYVSAQIPKDSLLLIHICKGQQEAMQMHVMYTNMGRKMEAESHFLLDVLFHFLYSQFVLSHQFQSLNPKHFHLEQTTFGINLEGRLNVLFGTD